jgi:hypothetical protein
MPSPHEKQQTESPIAISQVSERIRMPDYNVIFDTTGARGKEPAGKTFGYCNLQPSPSNFLFSPTLLDFLEAYNI